MKIDVGDPKMKEPKMKAYGGGGAARRKRPWPVI